MFSDSSDGARSTPSAAATAASVMTSVFGQAAILEQIAEGVIITDAEGRIVFVNAAAEALHGVRMLNVAPESYSEVYHLLTESGAPHPPEDLPLARAVLRGETVIDARWRIHRSDGSVVRAIGSARPVRDPDGRQTGAVLTLRDDTARAEAEEAQRQSEERLTLAQAAARIGTYDYHLVTGRMLWSPEMYTIYGLPPQRGPIAIETWRALVHPGDRDESEYARTFGAPVAGKSYAHEFRIVRPDGALRWIESRADVHGASDGAPERIVGVNLDITERKRHEEHQRLLIHELNHRTKNQLAIVQSLAQHTFKGPVALPEARHAFDGRLGALSAAHDLLTREKWEAAPIHQVIAGTLAAVCPVVERVAIAGPDMLLAPQTAVSLAMAVHELATNALKYGSLSVPDGTVAIDWSVADGRLRARWCERGGPAVIIPDRRGFGTRMVERALAAELGGQVRIDFDPAGVVCTIDAPVPHAPA